LKPAPFRYARPATLEETVGLLAEADGEARLLAGGQSLLPLLNMRLLRPAVLIDLALVPELRVLAREEHDLRFGAGVRQRTAETAAAVLESCPLVARALAYVGHLQTRTRGTIGGSLAYADPFAELPGVAVALEATLVAVGPEGARSIPARDFFLGPHTTALAPDEVLTEVRLPVAADLRFTFLEVAGRSPGATVTAVAAGVRLEDGGVAEARLVAVGVAGVPQRLASAEEAARGGGLDPGDRARIAAAAADDAPGKGAVVRTLVSRALAEVAA
jgi:aerobic carbon-monoxide dehydrogenase medium subunit